MGGPQSMRPDYNAWPVDGQQRTLSGQLPNCIYAHGMCSAVLTLASGGTSLQPLRTRDATEAQGSAPCSACAVLGPVLTSVVLLPGREPGSGAGRVHEESRRDVAGLA
eukprot:933856-Rhodomonas_salina.2